MKKFSTHFRAMILVSGMLISNAVPVSEPAKMFFLGLGLIGLCRLIEQNLRNSYNPQKSAVQNLSMISGTLNRLSLLQQA